MTQKETYISGTIFTKRMENFRKISESLETAILNANYQIVSEIWRASPQRCCTGACENQ